MLGGGGLWPLTFHRVHCSCGSPGHGRTRIEVPAVRWSGTLYLEPRSIRMILTTFDPWRLPSSSACRREGAGLLSGGVCCALGWAGSRWAIWCLVFGRGVCCDLGGEMTTMATAEGRWVL